MMATPKTKIVRLTIRYRKDSEESEILDRLGEVYPGSKNEFVLKALRSAAAHLVKTCSGELAAFGADLQVAASPSVNGPTQALPDKEPVRESVGRPVEMHSHEGRVAKGLGAFEESRAVQHTPSEGEPDIFVRLRRRSST